MSTSKSVFLVAAVVAFAAPLSMAQVEQEEGVRADIEAREGTPITFYGYIFSTGRGAAMPMNTQFPDGVDDYSRGIFGGCGTYKGVPANTLSPAAGTSGPCETWDQNENWWFTTPGFVQIKSLEEFSYEDLHNERGQTKDIYFDLAKPITGTYWLSADFHGWSVAFCDVSWCWNWDPGYLEDYFVEATVYHAPLGEHHTAASEEPDMGLVYDNPDATVIAYGRQGPQTVASFDPTLQPVAGPLCDGDCETVNQFDVALEYTDEFRAQGGIVPKENDIVVRWQWYQETDGEQYILAIGAVVGTAWNINAGEHYPPQIVFPIKNPLDVELVFPRFIHDKLVILSVLNTPWGSYDVDLESIELEVTDQNGNIIEVDPDLLRTDLDVSVAHSGHYNPIDVTWVWDYQKQDLAPGTYKAVVKAGNFQGSADTLTEASFSITEEGRGGSVEYGTEGLISFSDNELEQFQEGSQEEAQPGTGGEQLETEGTDGESEGSPGFAVPLAGLALLGLALAVRRTRQ